LNIKKFTFIGLLLISACQKNREALKPYRTSLIESVYASAKVQPDHLYEVYSSVGGILDKNLVEEGDTIVLGQPILQIINNTPKINMENAKLALQLAQENYLGSAAVLEEIQDEINAAAFKFQNDSINYFRQKNLWEQNIGSKVEYDAKKLNYELSKNNLNLLKSKYHRTKNELKTKVKQAENNYETTLIATGDFTVTGKINGKVYKLYKKPGEIVSTQQPLAAIGSSNVFVIEMLVDEVDIIKISIGQKVLLTLDAYNTTVFEAKVSKINPEKDERSQTFTIEALFEKVPPVLYPGLSGEANIIVTKKDSVLTIPKNYLFNGNKVITDNGEVSVSIGLQNIDRVEVLDGIDANTTIYKPHQ
jgi:HlyD family secretion protein